MLGRMYEEGRGVQKDSKSALEWYLKAAKFNNRYAQCHLGMKLL
jgi:TPR repeat protein